MHNLGIPCKLFYKETNNVTLFGDKGQVMVENSLDMDDRKLQSTMNLYELGQHWFGIVEVKAE